MLIFDKDDRIEQLKKIEKDLSKIGKLYVWGCSQTSMMLTDFLKRYSSIEIEAYIVDDAYYSFDVFEGCKVYKASDWKNVAVKGDYVLFGFTNGERANILKRNMPDGVEGVYFNFPYSANVNGEYITYDYYEKHKKEFMKTYELLADDKSKEIMEAFINGCITGNVEVLESLQSDGQYFNDLTKECACDCFVDLGAYVGDTIEKAYEFYEKSLKQVVSFEPDENNIALLKKRMKECCITEDKWTLIDKGSWSEQTSLYFSSSNSSSSITEDGDIRIEVDSVDNIMAENDLHADYIKMDVEGSEMESLQGAMRTIQENHPLLAICVYHKMSDLFELIQKVQEIVGVDTYNYYLRYHGPDLRELVLYAIPKC